MSKRRSKNRDRVTDGMRAERRERKRRLDAQKKSAAVRAKYGPQRAPAPVVVKSLTTGDVLEVRDQRKFAAKEYSAWLDDSARAAGYESYADYLRSPYWLAIRERVLERDERRCRKCKSRKRLSVHHRRYWWIGREKLDELVTLCPSCHLAEHRDDIFLT